jgi:hypothetical protein
MCTRGKQDKEHNTMGNITQQGGIHTCALGGKQDKEHNMTGNITQQGVIHTCALGEAHINSLLRINMQFRCSIRRAPKSYLGQYKCPGISAN